ncbi:hypothetical protein [Shimia sp. MMG029]|uniref:hypothetical protein n=1 Tax=Shimia sp. MMG029 TaxID=3021978 RepID=UPI0022FEC479|nr:hypothetical protein [Shimia sp. MMG029]MDA5556153.1 hypothetical protein [Shimia sp. MMG029]
MPKLQAALEGQGEWSSLKGYNTKTTLGLASDEAHVTLKRFDEPMNMQGFADVLLNPLIANTRPDLVKAIQHHKRALLIEIGPGNLPGFTQAAVAAGLGSDMLAELDGIFGNVVDQDSFEERMLIAQSVTCAVIDEMTPSAVHWAPSHQLMDGNTFKDLATDGFNLLLYVGAFPYDVKELADGSVKVGIRGFGSQRLVGKMVCFAPDTQDWADSYQYILAFVTYCRSIGRILGDNETFGMGDPDAPVIEVRHNFDAPQMPDGYIELRRRKEGTERRMAVKTMANSPDQLQAAVRGERNAMPNDMLKPRKVGTGGLRAKAQVLRGMGRVYKLGRLVLGLALIYVLLTQFPAPDFVVAYIENR